MRPSPAGWTSAPLSGGSIPASITPSSAYKPPGMIDGMLHALIYTVRGENVRAISLRKANQGRKTPMPNDPENHVVEAISSLDDSVLIADRM